MALSAEGMIAEQTSSSQLSTPDSSSALIWALYSDIPSSNTLPISSTICLAYAWFSVLMAKVINERLCPAGMFSVYVIVGQSPLTDTLPLLPKICANDGAP